MWMFYAIGSSFFAGITSILAKCGIRKTDSDVATAIRTIVVLLFSVLMTFITGSYRDLASIGIRSFVFLILLLHLQIFKFSNYHIIKLSHHLFTRCP